MFGSSLLPRFVWGFIFYPTFVFIYVYCMMFMFNSNKRGALHPIFLLLVLLNKCFATLFNLFCPSHLNCSFRLLKVWIPLVDIFVEDIIHSTKNSKQDTMVPPGKACVLTNNRFSNCQSKDKFHMQTCPVQLRYFGFIDVWTKLCKSKQDY